MKAIGYNPESKTLKIVFKNESAYSYSKVPSEVFQSLMSAESKGKFIHKNIKGKFDFEKEEK